MLTLIQDRRRWPTTLADDGGIWCAICLDDIRDAEQLQKMGYPPDSRKVLALDKHHPVGQAKIRELDGLLPQGFPVGWTVPVHSGCHITAKGVAEGIGAYLLDTLSIADLRERDKWARSTHEHGVYWYPMIMNLDTFDKFGSELSSRERATLMARIFSSWSGVRARVHAIKPQAIAEALPADYTSEVLFHKANGLANRECRVAAQETFDVATDRIGSNPDLILSLSQKLRTAQINRRAVAATDAKHEARRLLGEAAYTYATATLLQGWNRLAEGEAGAEECFDEILERLDALSWLYIAEALFGKALCWGVLPRMRRDVLYIALVHAQYIYVMLGLQPMPHAGLPASVPLREGPPYLPGNVLCSDLFGTLDETGRMELRRRAIGERHEADWLHRALVNTLAGRRFVRDRTRQVVEAMQ